MGTSLIDWDEKRGSLIMRLRRIEGQVRGLQRMLEEEQDCEKVAHQMAAARRALDKAFFDMMACAVTQEIGRHQPLTDDVESGVEEISRILAKYA
ncbi:MAG: hypothetical protein CMN28_09065 [Salinisphaeraceae bacterium]|jgi:DNA-binding FrmR family transcriptional regulator|nr:hypothetical protein [Salinisphaeraceae bacterium]